MNRRRGLTSSTGSSHPTDANMVRRWDNLKNVIAAHFPNMRTEGVPIKDAYDAQAILEQCASLIEDHPDDDWALNMTGGTKLMSAPAVEVFHRDGRRSTMSSVLRIALSKSAPIGPSCRSPLKRRLT